MSWFNEMELQRQIRELEDRVTKLETGKAVDRCLMCDIPLESLFEDGDVSGIHCTRADCIRRPRDKNSSAI